MKKFLVSQVNRDNAHLVAGMLLVVACVAVGFMSERSGVDVAAFVFLLAFFLLGAACVSDFHVSIFQGFTALCLLAMLIENTTLLKVVSVCFGTWMIMLGSIVTVRLAHFGVRKLVYRRQ